MTKTVYGHPVPRESRKYKRHMKGTYIGLVAYVIQDSPSKMLTFQQIMKKLGVFVTGDRKGLENNIRVCLSSSKCFVKVPIEPEYPNAKRNFWRVEENSITPKMLRRHFSDIAELFPGLPLSWNRRPTSPPVPSSPVCPAKKKDHPVKFTGPFSIESLLKKDPRPPVRITVQQSAQTTAHSRTATTDSLPCLGRENPPHSMHMYRSVQETRWMRPVERMDLSSELHHALLYSPHFLYDQTVLTKVSSSHTGHTETCCTLNKW